MCVCEGADSRPVILVVDDSEDHQTLLKAYLKKSEDYRCIYDNNGVSDIAKKNTAR